MDDFLNSLPKQDDRDLLSDLFGRKKLDLRELTRIKDFTPIEEIDVKKDSSVR